MMTSVPTCRNLAFTVSPLFSYTKSYWCKSNYHSGVCSFPIATFATTRKSMSFSNPSSFLHGQRVGVFPMLSTPKQRNPNTWKAIRGFPNEFNHNWNADGQRRLIDELVDFPCKFQFKVIGIRQGNFVGDIVDCVAEVLQIDPAYVEVSTKDKGKYRSITIDAPCNSSEQVYSIYAAIDRDPRVKFKF